jgi:hypothetical protein
VFSFAQSHEILQLVDCETRRLKSGQKMTDDLIQECDEHAKQARHHPVLGAAAIDADDKLASYVGRVLGADLEDTAGLSLGDLLRFVRTDIASRYDDLLARILAERGITNPQPVTPAVAIPLLRAAYDENRAELQDLWTRLLAAAMDPSRADAVRLSFIAAVKQLDPLDARLLLWMSRYSGPEIINVADRASKELNASPDELHISFGNLAKIGCISPETQRGQHPILAPFGRQLLSTCF